VVIAKRVLDRRSWNRTRPCSVSASRAATDTDLRSSGGRSRTCLSRLTVARLSARPHRTVLASRREEGEGVEPSTAEAAPVFETGYRASGSPSRGGPGRIRTCTAPGKSRQLLSVELRSRLSVAGRTRTCDASRFRRPLYRPELQPHVSEVREWARLDSNQQPLVCKTSALRN
jgi:hypothetical protein